MKTKKEIAEFVEKCLNAYSIPMVCYIKDEEKFEKESSSYNCDLLELLENEEQFNDNIRKISRLFGCSENDIINTNYNAVMDIYDKYPYFELFVQFNKLSQRSKIYNVPEEAKEKIINKIFGAKNICNIDFDESAINSISCITTELFNYPEIKSLLENYIVVYNRYSELFFKAKKEDLSIEEIHEFNVFSAHFVAMDAVCYSQYVSYEYIKKIRPILQQEKYQHLSHYIKVRKFYPWEARESFSDEKLIKEYIKVYPNAKKELREFCFLLQNYRYAYYSIPLMIVDSISIKKDANIIEVYKPYIENIETFVKSFINGGLHVVHYQLSKAEEECRMNMRLAFYKKEGMPL